MTNKTELIINAVIRFMLHAAKLDASGYNFGDDVVNDTINQYSDNYSEYNHLWNSVKDHPAVKRFYKFYYRFS